MASGDPVFISQEAGNGNVFSYTATTDIIITGLSCHAQICTVGTWVNGTSGIYSFTTISNTSAQNQTQLNKFVLKSGQTIYINEADHNSYGCWFGGFEL